MHYFPITAACRESMLKEIGVTQFDDLLKAVPKDLRARKLDLPESLSEMETVALLEKLGARNAGAGQGIFAGAGAYHHFIPAAVNAITSRGEFATAYTPYQAEASQGTLEAIFEYQTMITELTGLDVSNASLYDGAGAFAEACMLAAMATKRNTVWAAETVHPEYRAVAQTYFNGTERTVKTIPYKSDGQIDRSALEKNWTDDGAALAVQVPNFFGVVEDLQGLADWVHSRGGLFIVTANPLALGYFKSPGEYGADVVCGELQPLGIPLSYGGPYAGYFTTSKAHMRRVPGRICGETVDSEGARAFTLTLQAREQHIRRERATSNICTNQALLALRATVYMALMGQSGLRRVAELNMENAYYLRERLKEIGGVQLPFSGPIFNEFVARFPRSGEEMLEKLRDKNILGGVALSRFYPTLKNDVLICATELKTKDELDAYVTAVREVL